MTVLPTASANRGIKSKIKNFSDNRKDNILDVLMFDQFFLSPQVKRGVITINIHGTCKFSSQVAKKFKS